MKYYLWICLIFLLHFVYASIDTIDLHGIYKNSTSGEFFNGTYAMNVTIFNQSNDASVYTESKNIVVTNGTWNYIIGTVLPLNPFIFTSDAYFRIKIGSTLFPVTNFSKSPYAYMATYANKSLNDDTTTDAEILGMGYNHTTDIQTWANANDADTDTLYYSGTGTSINSSRNISVLPAYRLPQSCNDGEIAEYNTTSGRWDCAIDNSAASGMSSWVVVGGDTSGSESITDGETVTITKDSTINVTRSTNTLTIGVNKIGEEKVTVDTNWDIGNYNLTAQHFKTETGITGEGTLNIDAAATIKFSPYSDIDNWIQMDTVDNELLISAIGDLWILASEGDIRFQDARLNTTGNMTANYFKGDGSLLTNLPSNSVDLDGYYNTSNFTASEVDQWRLAYNSTTNNTFIYTNGSGLSLSGNKFNHTDTSTQASSDNSGRTYIQDITLDIFGHILTIATAAETLTNYIFSVDSRWIVNNSNTLTINESTFNATCDARDDNTTDTEILGMGYNHTTDLQDWVNANDAIGTDTNCSIDNSCNLITYDSETSSWDKDSSNDFTNISNITTNLTDQKVCVYSASSLKIECNHTDLDTDTNETIRFNALTSLNCTSSQKVIGVYINGTPVCDTDLTPYNTSSQMQDAINQSGLYYSQIKVNSSDFWDNYTSPTGWDLTESDDALLTSLGDFYNMSNTSQDFNVNHKVNITASDGLISVSGKIEVINASNKGCIWHNGTGIRIGAC